MTAAIVCFVVLCLSALVVVVLDDTDFRGDDE